MELRRSKHFRMGVSGFLQSFASLNKECRFGAELNCSGEEAGLCYSKTLFFLPSWNSPASHLHPIVIEYWFDEHQIIFLPSHQPSSTQLCVILNKLFFFF